MNQLTQGAQANLNGKMFENQIEYIIEGMCMLAATNYESQVPYTNLYGSDRARMDFCINGKINLNIECKYQKVSGSVDEKIPFCIENLLKQDKDGVLVLGGHHFYTARGEKILAWAENTLKNTKVSVVKADGFSDYLEELFRAKASNMS